MTQNIYDNPAFFAEYSRLRRSVEGLDGAPEWPSLRALVPDLKGRRVIDLGCGFGWFCRWARQAGAAQVLGLDVSENMLARARVTDPDDAVTYRREDLERLALPPASFDLAYSSLALHYIADLEGLLARLHRALAPGGRLVASVEHPIYSAPSDPKWVRDEAGRDVWPVDRYLDEGPRVTDWLAKGVVKQHRTIGRYAELLLRTGFTLSHLEEWGPTAAQIAEHPGYAIERERPAFLLLAADRR
jgi:SAM-dependent methyltransferase